MLLVKAAMIGEEFAQLQNGIITTVHPLPTVHPVQASFHRCPLLPKVPE